MSCAFVMVLFIALNYLLWDRENKINIDAHKNASISALGREINMLESSNSTSKDKISKLESTVRSLEQKNDELQQTKNKNASALAQKNEIIYQLKQMVDVKVFESILYSWTEAIDKGQYEIAYQLQLSQLASQQTMTLEEFTNQYKTNIKNIKVNTVTLNLQGVPEDKKGDISLRIFFDVKKNQNTGKFLFDEGANEKLVTLVFSKEKNTWVIGDIQAP